MPIDATPTTDELRRVITLLGQLPGAEDDGERIDRVRVLEELKCAAAAAQAVEVARFSASQRATNEAAGVPRERADRGVALQVGLAMRLSHHRAKRQVGWSTILTTELPGTLAALRAGVTSEWRAMLVARESIWLSREHRAELDSELAPAIAELGDRQVEVTAKQIAYRLDPHGFVERMRAAENDRRVGLRPAPDTMARLSGLVPVVQGVAAYHALCQEADRRRAAGDARGRGQIMADTFIERLTGQARADDVPVEVGLVIACDSLFGTGSGADEPAWLDGYGPIPAPAARDLITGAERRAPVWLRRLFTRPGGVRLMTMETTRRRMTATMAAFVRLRDRTCRTPFCGAPIRHVDHVRPHAAGGPTSIENSQALCEACNYAKDAPGWLSRPERDGTITTTTPTGHRYVSIPPRAPGVAPRGSPDFVYRHRAA